MTRYFISDTHFGHTKCWESFKRDDGTPLRPFTSTEEMNDTMIKNWNATVKPEDSVYFLGDFVINRKFMYVSTLLNGRKRLVRGNHDVFKTQEYMDNGWEEIYGVWVDPKAGIICSHIPIHPDSIKEGWINVHGHLHYGRVGGMQRPDKRYFNVAVEMINYTPVTVDEIKN